MKNFIFIKESSFFNINSKFLLPYVFFIFKNLSISLSIFLVKGKLDDLLLHKIMVIEKNLKMLHPEVFNNQKLNIFVNMISDSLVCLFWIGSYMGMSNSMWVCLWVVFCVFCVCFFLIHEDFSKGLRERNEQAFKTILETTQKYLFPPAKYFPNKLF